MAAGSGGVDAAGPDAGCGQGGGGEGARWGRSWGWWVAGRETGGGRRHGGRGRRVAAGRGRRVAARRVAVAAGAACECVCGVCGRVWLGRSSEP